MKKIIWGVTLAVAISCSTAAQAQISISVGIAPPALPIYVQPPIPGDGYMWTPGYWSWSAGDNDYYWVPGTWVTAPYVGALWTPGYWGWGNNAYAWHGGYWGAHIGYYGGINYGFGYGGAGYQGGHWDNGSFSYNRSVNNIGNNNSIHIYNARVTNVTVNRVSYNGGKGGIQVQPTRAEQSIAAMPHNAPTAPQLQHEQTSRSTPDLRASVNHGVPRIAATPEPGAFDAKTVVAARSEPVHASPARTQQMNRPMPQEAAHEPANAAPRPQNVSHAAPAHEAEEHHEK